MEYLQPNSDGSFSAVKIADGCDCFFATLDLNNDGIMEFIVPQFFTKKLVLVWTEHPRGDYSQPQFIRQRVIDDTIGAAFDIELFDLENDGELEILVTNHQSASDKIASSLWLYKVERPSMLVQDGKMQVSTFMETIKFNRHLISKDFTAKPGFQAAAPGSPRAFVPAPGQPPMIAVSGDATQKAHLLVRDHGDGPYTFKSQIVHDCKGTVGDILVEDLDGDGFVEMVIACYDTNYVVVYTFAP